MPVIEDDFVLDTEDILAPEAEPGLDNGKAIQNQLGSLFLRMQTLLHVSNSAVQEIIDELFDIGEFAHQNIKTVIDKVLKDNNCIADASVVASLTDEIQTHSNCSQGRGLLAQSTKDSHFIEITLLLLNQLSMC